MRGDVVLAIVTFLASLGSAALMLMYPQWRGLWWLILSACIAGMVFCLGTYFIEKFDYLFDFHRLRFLLVCSISVIGFLACVSLMLTFDPEASSVFHGENSEVLNAQGELRLQFYGDYRIPECVSSSNVVNWFTYYSPSLSMTPLDINKNPIAGGWQIPPCWVIFINLDKPTTYKQVKVSFSNSELMPITEVRMSTTRTIAVTTRSQIPAGILEIHVE